MNTALRCATSAAVGSGLGTTIKYLQKTTSGAAGNGRAQRSNTCDAQQAAPRATAWAPRSSTCDSPIEKSFDGCTASPVSIAGGLQSRLELKMAD